MKLEKFIGKNIIEVVLNLPKIEWVFNYKGRIIKPEINQLIFVNYDEKKPRNFEDSYQSIETSNLSLETLKEFGLIERNDGRVAGLTSKVILKEPYNGEFVHIPMMDFDRDRRLDFLDEEEFLELIKEGIKETTELKEGLLLASSDKNYHFISVGRLMDETDFITFCGLCLTMSYKTKNGEVINLADSRYIGHSLSPLKYFTELSRREDKNWSTYDWKERFATLRTSSKKRTIPMVRGVLK